jgi:hypothetical protein
MCSPYVFSRPPAIASIPKACGFEAATRLKLILSCGSPSPIVIIGMEMAPGRQNKYNVQNIRCRIKPPGKAA